MRKIFVILALLMALSACAGPTPVSTPTMTLPPPTATRILPTSTPTEVPTPTKTVPILVIDVAKPSSEWDLSSLPEDQRTAIEHWLADPYTSTTEEKQIADDFLIQQWQLALGTEATGHDLYERIIAYGQSSGGEIGLLPNTLHLMERTNEKNVVIYGPAPGKDKWTKFSYYGFGMDIQNPKALIDIDAELIDHINFYGNKITRVGKIFPITTELPLMGDIVSLFELPGIEHASAQGAIVKLIDTYGKSHYVEIQIQYDNTMMTSDKDMCMGVEGIYLVGKECPAGITLPQTLITPYHSRSDHHPLTHDNMIQVLRLTNYSLHISTYGGVGGRQSPGEHGIWQNGLFVIKDLLIFADIPIQ